MGEIVNLRRARKARERAAKEAEAAANRLSSGVSKTVRRLEEARSDKQERDLEARHLDPSKDTDS